MPLTKETIFTFISNTDMDDDPLDMTESERIVSLFRFVLNEFHGNYSKQEHETITIFTDSEEKSIIEKSKYACLN